ncbi:MAG: beta-lactamase domain protein [Gemmatimonadetes bacterium]|nr:beta-lactamase domain protein [Gemmatimonadota bacterium]
MRNASIRDRGTPFTREARRWPREVHVEKHEITVSVTGGGNGESILMNVGNALIGIVDSCAAVAEGGSSVRRAIDSLLSAQTNVAFGFIVLTHPHLDHFEGMDRLYAEYGKDVIRACLFQGTTELELSELFNKREKQPQRSARAYRFFKSYSKILQVYRDTLTGAQRFAIGDGSEICALEVRDSNGRAVRLRVSCLAPSRDDVELFLMQAKMTNCYDIASGGRQSLRQRCNGVSAVLRIEFGETRIMLGGDAELDSWRQIQSKNGPDELASDVLKVSHHGSRTGMDAALAAVLSKGKRGRSETVAVVTPSFLHGLPHDETLAVLDEHFDRVIVSVGQAQETMDVGSWVGKLPQVRGISAIQKYATNAVSLTYDATGHCLDITRDV